MRENSHCHIPLLYRVFSSPYYHYFPPSVVSKERPDLENARSTLLNSTAEMRREIRDTEDKILAILSDTAVNSLTIYTVSNMSSFLKIQNSATMVLIVQLFFRVGRYPR